MMEKMWEISFRFADRSVFTHKRFFSEDVPEFTGIFIKWTRPAAHLLPKTVIYTRISNIIPQDMLLNKVIEAVEIQEAS